MFVCIYIYMCVCAIFFSLTRPTKTNNTNCVIEFGNHHAVYQLVVVNHFWSTFFFLSKNDVYHLYKYTSKYHVHHDQMHYSFGCRPGKPMSNLSRVRWDIPCRWMDNRYSHQIFCVTKSIENIKKHITDILFMKKSLLHFVTLW